MRSSLEDYIFTKKVIPENVCSDLIKDIQGLDWHTHTWYHSKLDKHIDGYNELFFLNLVYHLYADIYKHI